MIQIINKEDAVFTRELREMIESAMQKFTLEIIEAVNLTPRAEAGPQTKNSDYNGFVSRQEVMSELRLSPSGIYQVTQKHKIVGKRIGKKIYYKRSDIDKLFEN